jgi:hypothetical protein
MGSTELHELQPNGYRASYTNNENSVTRCRSTSLAKLEAILSVVTCRRQHKATDTVNTPYYLSEGQGEQYPHVRYA